jgi:predicted transcriptional regulator
MDGFKKNQNTAESGLVRTFPFVEFVDLKKYEISKPKISIANIQIETPDQSFTKTNPPRLAPEAESRQKKKIFHFLGEAIMSRRREEQDMMDKVILAALKNGHIRWTVLEKKVLTTCHSLATRTRFDNRLRYLLKKECIERVSRGIYRITEKGEKYMQVI